MPFQPPPSEIAAEVQERFVPFINEWIGRFAQRAASDAPIGRPLINAAGALHLLDLTVPVKVGGTGRDPFSWGVIMERLAYACDDFSFPLLIGTMGLVASGLASFEKPDIDRKWVGPLMRGECIGSWAHSTTDPRETQCQVNEANQLTGNARFLVGGTISDVFVVVARNPNKRIGLYLVEATDPGVSITTLPATGTHAAGFASIRFDGVELAPDRILTTNEGVDHALAFHNRWSALLICVVLGRMYAVTDRCVRFLTSVMSSDAMADPLHLRSTLGVVYAALESSRTVVYRALDRLRWSGADPKWDPQISLAKYHVAEQSVVLGLQLMQLVGADGYAMRLGVESYLRDVFALTPVAGAHHDLGLSLGYQALAEHASRKPVDLAWAKETIRAYWFALPWWKRFVARLLGRVPEIIDDTPVARALPSTSPS